MGSGHGIKVAPYSLFAVNDGFISKRKSKIWFGGEMASIVIWVVWELNWLASGKGHLGRRALTEIGSPPRKESKRVCACACLCVQPQPIHTLVTTTVILR